MRARISSIVAVFVAVSIVAPARATPTAERTQFILLGLDTTPSGRRAAERTDFHRILRRINRTEHPTAQAPASFTLFISTGGLSLDPASPSSEDREYLGRLPRNRPMIRYADDLAHLRARVGVIARLDELGVEIAAHGVRHERGRGWSAERWRSELEDHRRILDLVGLPAPAGFRAPFMEHNEALYAELAAHGFRYDVSRAGRGGWPRRHPSTGVWLFEIPSVRIAGRPSLLFDLAMERAVHAAANAAHLEGSARAELIDRAVRASLANAFARHYNGHRAPFVISGHGRLLTPILRFMREACARPSVRCATFSEAVRYMEDHPELEGLGADR